MRSTVLGTPATLLLVALMASGAAAATPPKAADGPPANQPGAKTAAEAQEEGEHKLVCKRESSTGSFLSAERTCRKVRNRKRSTISRTV
jgi:hypothetical protein